MFIWKKELELGIRSIDKQHRKLFEIGNKIHDLVITHREGDDDYDEIHALVAELKDYTVYHFKTEEELFLKHGYTEYEKHKKEHDGFVAYLESLDFESIDENQTQFLKELLEKIAQWIFRHIISTDFKYRDYLLQLGTQ